VSDQPLVTSSLAFATEETYLHSTDRAREEALTAYLSVVIGHETYGLPTEAVREIIKLVEVTELPRVPSFLVGIISVRGAIIPVMDLRERLGLGRSTVTRASRVVIVANGNQRYGLRVEAVVGLERFRQSDVEPSPSIFGAGRAGAERYIEGLGRTPDRPDRIVMFLDLAPLWAIGDELARHRKLRQHEEQA